MRPAIACVLLAAACSSRSTQASPAAPGAACDPRGVWQLRWQALGADQVTGAREVTIDPDLVRVELPDHELGHDEGVALGFEPSACRLHVVERWTQRYEEGYGDQDHTVRLAFTLGDGPREVRGHAVLRVLDPPQVTEHAVRGSAERRAGWTPPPEAP